MIVVLLFITLSVAGRHPVLLIPGLSGSQILYKPKSDSDWEVLWLNVIKTLDPNWFPLVEVKYDPDSDVYSSAVESQVRHWGSVEGIDHLDNNFQSLSYVYHHLIDALEDAKFSDEKDMFGAPYDFRLESYVNAPKPGGLFENLKELIEKMVALNGELAVVVTHSQGSAVFRHFLANYVDRSWKNQYIKSWISAAGAFAGAPSAFHYLISYKQWLIPTINAKNTHDLLQFISGIYWMLPTLRAFSSDFLLADVSAGNERFFVTVGNMTEGFKRSVGEPQLSAANNTLNAVNAEFLCPNVEMYIHYGSNIGTTTSEKYVGGPDDWWQQDGEANEADGDGTVPIQSLTAPMAWLRSSTAPIYMVERVNVSHMDIINDEAFMQDVITIATEDAESEAARGIYTLRRRHVRTLREHVVALQAEAVGRLKAVAERAVEAVKGLKGVQEDEGRMWREMSHLVDEAVKTILQPTLTKEHEIYKQTRLSLRSLVERHLPALAAMPLASGSNPRPQMTTIQNGPDRPAPPERRAVYDEYDEAAAALVKTAMAEMDGVHALLLGKGGALDWLELALKRVFDN